MSAPRAPPNWSPPSGGATGSESEPDSPSSDGTSSPRAPPTGTSSIASSSTPPPRAPATGPGGGSPPPGCAACRHKRQRCPPGCALAPYFPADDDPDRFRSVLRVFGVKNLLRTLREVPRPRWDACVRTLVHESRMRLADPVRGCVGAIEDLEAQLVDTAVELEVLRRRQEAYRQAKKRRGLRWFRPADPGEAAARQQPGTGRTRGDSMIQPQDPYGAAWQPATAGLAATQARLSPTQPQVLSSWASATTGLTAAQPQLSAMLPPQLYATQPQFLPMRPQPAMRRQPTPRATAMVHDGFGNAWANDDERGDPDPDDM